MDIEEKKSRFKNIIEETYDKCMINGIGTYQEKTLHKIVKNFYETDINKQEVKVNGFVADILNDNEIIEIQTRAFNKLVPKLNEYLKDYKVNIVYPIPYIKYVCWLDNGGCLVSERKSPKKGSIYDSIKELYKIKWFLNNPNLKVTLLFINLKEYRNLDGYSKDKKKGSTRFDRVPSELVDEVVIDNLKIFVPYDYDEEFSSKEFAKKIHKPLFQIQTLLNILNYNSIVEVVRKEGKLNIYKLKK